MTTEHSVTPVEPARPPGGERRKRRLVDDATQRAVIGHFSRRFVLHLAVFAGLFALMAPAAAALYAEHLSAGHSPWTLAGFVVISVAVPAVCSFLFLFGHTLRDAGRVVGPCYRFRRVFEAMRTGALPRGVRIRRDDYLQETAQELDQTLVHLHDSFAGLRTHARQMEENLARVTRDSGHEELDDVRSTWRELRVRIDAFTLVSAAPECRPLDEAQASVEASPVVEAC